MATTLRARFRASEEFSEDAFVIPQVAAVIPGQDPDNVIAAFQRFGRFTPNSILVFVSNTD